MIICCHLILTTITHEMKFIHSFFACCVRPYSTKCTLYQFSAIYLLSVIQIQSSIWTTSIIILCFLIMEADGNRLFYLPIWQKYLCTRNLFSGNSSHILQAGFSPEMIPVSVIWILLFCNMGWSNCNIQNSILIQREQASIRKAVTYCCWLEGTTLSTSK